MPGVGGEGRVSEHGRQQPVLGQHHEAVERVVDDADGVELEEPFRHHEGGLAGVADRPVPAAGARGGVAAHLVVRVEPPLGLQRRQHQLVAAEEGDELLAVAPHVGPALGRLLLVAEHQVGLPGGQVDREPRDLAGVRSRVPGLVARRQPGRVVVGQREQGAGEEAAGRAGRRRSQAVDLVVEVVDEAEHAHHAPGPGALAGPQLEHAAHAVAGPVEQQLAVGPGQSPLGGDEPLGGGESPGRGECPPQLDGAIDQLWTHGM